MGIILDLLFVIIFIAAVAVGIKKGFIRSIMNIVSFAGAVLCAYYISPAISVFIKNNIIGENLSNSISNVLNSIISGGVEKITLPQIFADKPDAFVDITDRYNVTINSVEQYYNEELAETTAETVGKVSDFISGHVADTLSAVVSFVVVFIIALLVFRLVIMIIDMISRLPVLNFTNRFLGAIFGVISGYLFVSITAVVAAELIPSLNSVWPDIINDKLLDTSNLYPWLEGNNVFALLFGWGA